MGLIILGFTFVPFLLLRHLDGGPSGENPFSTFTSTISQLLNFISSDYGALEPFESSSAAIRTLRATYIVVITIFFLNMLIAMLNLKIKRADKNAANLYHLQMASLQVEIELGLLSASERTRRDWFPTWFSYSMTETEKRAWGEYVERNPLQWTKDNDFGEEKENVPPPKRYARLDAFEDEAQPGSSIISVGNSTTQNHTVVAQPSPNTVSVSNSTMQNDSESAHHIPQSGNGKDVAPSQESNGKQNASPGVPQPVQGEPPVSKAIASNTSEELQESPKPSLPPVEKEYIVHTCKICGKGGRLCIQCRSIAYCGTEHQKQDWKSHKQDCRPKDLV
jgi:MYND finger